MKIAILGGSFNPPHVAHLLAAVWVLSTRPVDQLWFMPVGEHTFGKELESFEHRWAMTRLAIAPLGEHARATDVENRLGGPSRTVDTMAHLASRHPTDDFSLVIGADILQERHSWKKWDVLEKDYGFHVLGRDGYVVPPGYGVSVVLPDISSTAIRERLRLGEIDGCSGWMNRDVLDYIAAHRLFDVPEGAAATSRGGR